VCCVHCHSNGRGVLGGTDSFIEGTAISGLMVSLIPAFCKCRELHGSQLDGLDVEANTGIPRFTTSFLRKEIR
jgi:hypothetical protein